MKYIEHKFSLDVNRAASQICISVKKGDTARRLLIHLTESGYPYHLSNECYAVFTAKKPDGHVLFNDCTIDDCTIRYDFTDQTVPVSGPIECEIVLYGSGGKQLTSAGFHMIVEDTIYDTETEIESTDEYNALAALVAEVQALKAQNFAIPPIIVEAEGELISVKDSSNNPMQGIRIFGKSTQDGTPTPSSPVEIVSIGSIGKIAVKVLGKNIVSALEYSSSNKDYGTLVKSRGTRAIQKGKTYTISVNLTADKATSAYWNNTSGFFAASELFAVSAGTNRYSKTFTALEDGDSSTMKTLLSKASGGDGVTITPSYCQIELGAVATEYELTEQSVTVSTPDGLPGIPVTSGGNYIDSNGQQWICDEIDLVRGVYVQRIGKIDLSTLSIWTRGTGNGWANTNAFYSPSAIPKAVGVDGYESKANLLCNRLVIGTASKIAGRSVNSVGQGTGTSLYVSVEGIETAENLIAYFDANKTVVQYVLAKPIETALTAEQIAAYAALHTNKPNTTIYNDAGAYMAAEYVADTKTYIDNKSGSTVVSGDATLVDATVE